MKVCPEIKMAVQTVARNYPPLLTVIAAVVAIVVLDLSSKAAMTAWLGQERLLTVTPFFNLRLSFNPGISFGFFPAESDLAQNVLVIFALLAAVLLFWLALRAPRVVERLALGLLSGGAIANALDRAGDGFVTDFLDLHAFGWHWPTFNVADIAITCGAIGIIATTIFVHDPHMKDSSS